MRRFWLSLAWAWCGAIVYLSLMDKPPQGPDVPLSDKLGHLLAYAGLMLQFRRLYAGRAGKGYAAAFVAMGVGLECLQYFTATRSFEVADMGANTLGVAAGYYLGSRLS